MTESETTQQESTSVAEAPDPATPQPTQTEQGAASGEALTIPKHRYDEVAKRAKAAEKRAAELEQAEEQRQTERAEKTGEFQTVIDRLKKQLQQEKDKAQQLQNQIVRDKRFRAWTQGANGIIRSDALGDAFEYITDDEWQSVNEDDENSVRMLAQSLAERKSFLSGGPIGAGSGGSSRPILGGGGTPATVQDNRNPNAKTLSSGRQVFDFRKHKRHF